MAAELPPEERDEMAIPSYLHRNPAMRWMAWRRVHVVAERLQLVAASWRAQEDRHIVDFGCGAGVLLEEASRIADSVTGIDIVLRAAEMLVAELRLTNVTLLSPDQAAAAIEPASTDVVIAGEVLEHLEDDLPTTLERFRTWLKPTGRLLVSLPTESRLYRAGRRLAGFSGHYHHHNAAALDAAIATTGFRRLWLDKLPLGGPFTIYWVAEYAPPIA
ncbi:MAG TPA: class I SAM-dependent methyltransferase [Kofleriaceae bacterium]|nr:class I SAM-dependent methyltransferase [Kofleriaceae bacterium]